MSTAERYRLFWATKAWPMTRSNTPEYYQFMGNELRMLWGPAAPKRILELGCGNGAMFPFLEFPGDGYKGVDFTRHFITDFQAHHPGVDVECREASSYVDNNSYDLIFSNELVQHFDAPMLLKHFQNARSMMHPESLFVCAGIPWKAHRSRFRSGVVMGGRPSLLRSIKCVVRDLLGKDGMGHWYDLSEIQKAAEDAGMSVKFHGSLMYLYRFHAVMQLRPPSEW